MASVESPNERQRPTTSDFGVLDQLQKLPPPSSLDPSTTSYSFDSYTPQVTIGEFAQLIFTKQSSYPSLSTNNSNVTQSSSNEKPLNNYGVSLF